MPSSSRLSGREAISILHSKRQGVYYLEHCRILMRDDRLEFAMDRKPAGTYFWNIPTANTIVLLLGSGTSLTQAAARRLAEDGVMFAFVGGGGSPLFLASQSEYRPTEFCQGWLSRWQVIEQRLEMAIDLQKTRCTFIRKTWATLEFAGTKLPSPDVALTRFENDIGQCHTAAQLLEAEARCAKRLYAALSGTFAMTSFTRKHGARDEDDLANSFLDHGNYIAYGLAAAVLWVLGIPHSLPVLHGQTRRGALVFDVADLVKDGIVMPTAFACAAEENTGQEFRDRCVRELHRADVMDLMFAWVKNTARASTA